MRLFREWAPTVFARSGMMLDRNAIDNVIKYRHDPGYTSVYMLNEVDANTIRTEGFSRGFDRFVVYADALILDIDDGDASITNIINNITSQGYPYRLWSSGGKGYHVVIPHELKGSMYLPHSHRKVVESLGLNVDLSLYQSGRLISLPGRVHPRTKKKKEFIESCNGKRPLEVPIVQPEARKFNVTEVGSDADMFAMALCRLLKAVNDPPKAGNRHNTYWGIATCLRAAGLPLEASEAIIQHLNTLAEDVADEDGVSNSVLQAFRR